MISAEQQKILATFLFGALPILVTGKDVGIWVGQEAALRIESIDRTFNVAKWIIDQVLREPTPDRFVLMVTTLDNHSGALDTVVKLVEMLQADPAKWVPAGAAPTFDWTVDGDPLSIVDGRPFIDRIGFRHYLPRRGMLNTPSCIVVLGDSGAGKTYLHEFCKAFSTARQGFRLAHASVGAGSSSAEFAARTVARELAFGLRIKQSTIPPPHEDPLRDAENLAGWLIHYTTEEEVPAVALIDEIGHTDLAESVHRLILELSLAIQKDERKRAKLRLVLMGYDTSGLSAAGINYETYVLEQIEEEHLAQWFRSRFPNHPDYRYSAAAKLVLQRVATHPQRQRMLALNQEVRSTAEEFA